MTILLAGLALVLGLVTPVRAAICTTNVGATPQRCSIPKHRKPHVHTTRDAYGAPHVRGNNLYDAGYGIGQAQAEDRLFQMEFVRKSASGHLAEVAGTSFLSDDQDARRQFYTTEE